MSESIKCSNCDLLWQQNDTYWCNGGGKIETLKELPSWCPRKKNCHNYCHYRKQCRYAKGEDGINPEDCAMYWKIEDIMNDAKADEMEERRQREDDDW